MSAQSFLTLGAQKPLVDQKCPSTLAESSTRWLFLKLIIKPASVRRRIASKVSSNTYAYLLPYTAMSSRYTTTGKLRSPGSPLRTDSTTN